MAKPIKPSRGFHPVSSAPSRVKQSLSPGDSMIRRVHEQQQGLRLRDPAQFVDMRLADPEEYINSLNLVSDVKRRFAALPARLRAECLNDPRQLLVLAEAANRGDQDAVDTLVRHKVIKRPQRDPQASPGSPAVKQEDLVEQAGKPPK